MERAVEAANNAAAPSSPGGGSIVSVSEAACSSPLRQPPPYKAPPEVQQSPTPPPTAPPIATAGVAVHPQQVESYRECVNEFTVAMQSLDPARLELQSTKEAAAKKANESKSESEPNAKSVSRANSVDETGNKENIPRFSFSSGASTDSSSAAEKLSGTETDAVAENPISVKEATRKFNRMASEEEAKIISPPAKKKPEKVSFLLEFASTRKPVRIDPITRCSECGCREPVYRSTVSRIACCLLARQLHEAQARLTIPYFLWETHV